MGKRSHVKKKSVTQQTQSPGQVWGFRVGRQWTNGKTSGTAYGWFTADFVAHEQEPYRLRTAYSSKRWRFGYLLP